MNKDCNCHKGQGDVCPIHGIQDKPTKNLRQQIYDKIRTYRPNVEHNDVHAERITDEIMACVQVAVHDEAILCKHRFMPEQGDGTWRCINGGDCLEPGNYGCEEK